jgi:CspA family cold shock protein
VHTATLKFFNHDRGFGFLINDMGGENDFLHASQLRLSGISADALRDGETRFRYDTEPTKNGRRKP